jgi:hypothetical protein
MFEDWHSNFGYWTAGAGLVAWATYLIMAVPDPAVSPIINILAAAAFVLFFLVDIVDQAIQSTCRWPS